MTGDLTVGELEALCAHVGIRLGLDDRADLIFSREDGAPVRPDQAALIESCRASLVVVIGFAERLARDPDAPDARRLRHGLDQIRSLPAKPDSPRTAPRREEGGAC